MGQKRFFLWFLIVSETILLMRSIIFRVVENRSRIERYCTLQIMVVIQGNWFVLDLIDFL